MEKLNTDCQGMPAFHEWAKILNARDRELVIGQVMVMESVDIDLYQLKSAILMALLTTGKGRSLRMDGGSCDGSAISGIPLKNRAY